MKNKKVLIVYGSRFGSTEEISLFIAKILTNNSITAEVVDLRKTKEENWPLIDQYTGILIGTGIMVGSWTKEVKKFVTSNKQALDDKLKSNRSSVGFFISSGNASVDSKKQLAVQEYLVNKFTELKLPIIYYEAFGALMDFSKSSKMGRLKKFILRSVVKDDLPLIPGARNDFRNWNQIEDFAIKYSQLLEESL